MTRVIIIEDEYSPRQMLRDKLTQHFHDIEIAAECDSAETGLIEILRLRPDLIFLDIQMSGNNGLWLADELMRMDGDAFSRPDIIFTTGYTYSEYLLKAFELAAIDYLVKPVSIEGLEKAIGRYRERAGEKASGLQNLMDAIADERLMKFKSFNGLYFIRPEDIAYISADHDYSCMYLANGEEENIFERLGEIEQKLPQEYFVRTGKSVVVNLKYIRKVTDNALYLVNGTTSYTVNVSREAVRQLKTRL